MNIPCGVCLLLDEKVNRTDIRHPKMSLLRKLREGQSYHKFSVDFQSIAMAKKN